MVGRTRNSSQWREFSIEDDDSESPSAHGVLVARQSPTSVPPRHRCAPSSPGPRGHQYLSSASPWRFLSSDRNDFSLSEAEDSTKATVTSSSEEDVQGLEGSSLPLSRAPILSPILEIEDLISRSVSASPEMEIEAPILGILPDPPTIMDLPCLTAIFAGAHEDELASVRYSDLVSPLSPSPLAVGVVSSDGAIFCVAGNRGRSWESR
ncbi:hypothetical protein Dimus_010685 [Dionaea muscipula]